MTRKRNTNDFSSNDIFLCNNALLRPLKSLSSSLLSPSLSSSPSGFLSSRSSSSSPSSSRLIGADFWQLGHTNNVQCRWIYRKYNLKKKSIDWPEWPRWVSVVGLKDFDEAEAEVVDLAFFDGWCRWLLWDDTSTSIASSSSSSQSSSSSSPRLIAGGLRRGPNI